MNLYLVKYKNEDCLLTVAKNSKEAKNKLYRKRLAKTIKLIRHWYFKDKKYLNRAWYLRNGLVFPIQFTQGCDVKTCQKLEIYYAYDAVKLELEEYKASLVKEVEKYKVKLEKIKE